LLFAFIKLIPLRNRAGVPGLFLAGAKMRLISEQVLIYKKRDKRKSLLLEAGYE
jgi:hypothetical protein